MPWEALAATVTKLEGPIQKRVEMNIDGQRSSFRIADVLECQATPLKNPATGEVKEVHITYPKGGFFWNEGNVVTTEVTKISWGDLNFEYSGKFAAVAEVNWTNQG